jgi:hypothetical protein
VEYPDSFSSKRLMPHKTNSSSRIQVLFVLLPRLTHASPVDSLLERFGLMVTSSNRSKSFSTIQENFQIRLRSIRLKCISSIRTPRRAKLSHRRSSTLQTMTAASESLLFKPLKRSLSLCSLTSDEYISDDEIGPCFSNEKGYLDIASRENAPTKKLMNSPKAPAPSLRMRPSPCSRLIIDSLPFPTLTLQPTPNRWYDFSPEISALYVTMTESTISSDYSDDEGSLLQNIPEHERNSTTLDVEGFILNTPKTCYLESAKRSLSPPPLRSANRNVIYPDAFKKDLATNQSLFLPDAF